MTAIPPKVTVSNHAMDHAYRRLGLRTVHEVRAAVAACSVVTGPTESAALYWFGGTRLAHEKLVVVSDGNAVFLLHLCSEVRCRVVSTTRLAFVLNQEKYRAKTFHAEADAPSPDALRALAGRVFRKVDHRATEGAGEVPSDADQG